MNLITLDFETFYDKDFSLSKLTTEEYIRDDRFEVIGVGVKVNDDTTQWFTGNHADTSEFLSSFDWDSSFLLAHNCMFDGAILSWRFGIRPKVLLDTLAMLRAIDGTEVGNSLAKAAERYGLGVKGTEVVAAVGKRRADFTEADLKQYGEYCKNDVKLTYDLFNILQANFQKPELKLIDMTLRMFTEPTLRLDLPVLEQHLVVVQEKKEALIAEACADREVLMSNQKFAERLIEYGVPPPMKVSPTTGKQALALAKSDEGFKALADHWDERVQALVAARLGTKSTLEETRTQRFISIAKRGSLPVPLRYYAAHTGRWGGDDKLNLQNLPRKSPLKTAIVVPEGYVMIDADSSQIEARIVAWLAGQADLVSAFAKGEDVYKTMAAKIYSKPVEEIDDSERFVGKTTILGCISAGSMILCDSGWKPIEQVSLKDRLWDGEEWVCHQGLQNSGIKETLNLCGMWLTPDHKVWSGTQWLEAQSLVQDANTLSQALGTAVENLPLQAIYGEVGEGLVRLSSNATADLTPNTVWTHIISKISKAQGVHFAPKLRRTQNGIGYIHTQWKTTGIEHDFSTDWLLPSQGATTSTQQGTKTTGVEAYTCINNGGRIEPPFSNMYKRLKVGITHALKWIGLITTKDTNPTIYDLLPEAKTCGTNDESQTLRRKLQTYDLAYAGPRNRYTVLTTQGPMIVHNCGYGMGWRKFQIQLKNFGVSLDDNMCQHILKVYRQEFPYVPALWDEGHKTLDALASPKLVTTPFGKQAQAVSVLPGIGYDLPSGLPLKYMNLRSSEGDLHGRPQYVYDTRKGVVRIYGGKVVENLCQALARCVIGEQMLRIAKRYKPVLTVHDAVACVVPESERDEAIKYVNECMRWRPKWAETLPLACEIGAGKSYADCGKKMSIEKWGLV